MRKRARESAAAASAAAASAAAAAPSTSPPPPTKPKDSPLDPAIFSPTRVAELRASFAAARPYAHAVIRGVMRPDEAAAVHEEIGRLHGNLKETDLFRVYQTGELANADEADATHAAQLPTLLAMRRAINSPEFRSLIETVSGCGPLSNQVDLSGNVYARGCHLLCHDDVIGTRRISYIVYVGSPHDEPWTPDDGGRLELYESDPATRLPLPEPCVRVPPTFNTMAFFVVEPGVSFHSVEEVFSDKARVSLQGWFHAAQTPEEMGASARATLQHLLHSGNLQLPALAPRVDVSSALTSGELSPADVAELSEWINPSFLTPDMLDAMKAKCETEDGCVSLLKFLRKELAESVRGKMAAPRAEAAWRVVGPAHVQRFMVLGEDAPVPPDSFEAALRDLAIRRLSSPAFTRLLSRVTALQLSHRRVCVRRFRKGSDYTVAYAHDEPNVIDVTLCFVDDSTSEFADEWASGDVGGQETYLEREEDGVGDVAVYRGDVESAGLVTIDPAFATLAIVDRDQQRMHFVKYVSKGAPSDRFDVACTFEFVEVGGDDDEEEEAAAATGAASTTTKGT